MTYFDSEPYFDSNGAFVIKLKLPNYSINNICENGCNI